MRKRAYIPGRFVTVTHADVGLGGCLTARPAFRDTLPGPGVKGLGGLPSQDQGVGVAAEPASRWVVPPIIPQLARCPALTRTRTGGPWYPGAGASDGYVMVGAGTGFLRISASWNDSVC